VEQPLQGPLIKYDYLTLMSSNNIQIGLLK